MAAVGKSSEPEITELPAGNGEEEEKATGDREESMEDEDFTVQLGATYSCKRQDGTYHDAKVTKTRMNKRAGREEFYVQYVGLNSRQNEWVDKTRLVLVDQMEEEEDVEDDMDEETSANDNSQLEKKTEEDEPVSKKPKVEIQEASTSSSVVDAEDFAEDLTCPLCNKLFNDPVVVECGHNFCHSCIDQAWEGQDSFTCPDCKEVITDKRYTNNRILANLVKKTVGLPFGALLHSPTAGLTPAKSLVKEKPQPTANCLMHDERLKLFCKDDGDLACVICRESLKHATHNFLPILDAMGVYREELSSIVNPLEEALKMAEQLAKQQNEKIERHTANMLEYRAHIEAEFEKMHKLLKEREEQLLGKLQAEGGTLLMEMEANVAKLQENIDCIKKSIASASEKLDDKDSISFLTDIKAFIKKCQEQQEEALSSGSSIIDRQLNRETYMAPINFSVTEGLKITPTQKPKEIWIIGNFWVAKAGEVARYRPCGENLGLDEKQFAVRWLDKYDLQWRDLLHVMRSSTSSLGEPSIVFIHLGSSDLKQEMFHDLTSHVKRDLGQLIESYPKTAFIWSLVMPRREWLNTPMERQRKQFNTIIFNHAKKLGVQVADLRDVEKMSKEHLHCKNKYALEHICDVFNRAIKCSLESAINKISK